MTSHRHRPLSAIAEEILRDKTNFPIAMRAQLAHLRSIDQVTDEDDYTALARMRRLLGGWRSVVARRIKPEIDTILSLYRVARWDSESRGAGHAVPASGRAGAAVELGRHSR